MKLSNLMSASLFTQPASKSHSMYSLLANSMYAKTTAKFVIEAHYGNNSAHHTYPSKPQATTDTAKKAANFLDSYTKQTKSLDEATNNLKNVLANEKSSEADKIEATKKYVSAYNSSMDFLSEHSSDRTYTMNSLKNSLESIGSNAAFAYSLGITQNSDGSLKLDTKVLSESLTKDAVQTNNKLSSLARVTSGYTAAASKTSNVNLLKEQNVLTTDQLQSASGLAYNDVTDLIKNPTRLQNYYYGMACSGLFLDTVI